MPRILTLKTLKMNNILSKIKSVKYCMMAHPDNEEGSEFEDRISDLQEIEDKLSNNGWTIIEKEEDLPDLKDEQITFLNNNILVTFPNEDVQINKKTFLRYSHFRIKEKFLKPLF